MQSPEGPLVVGAYHEPGGLDGLFHHLHPDPKLVSTERALLKIIRSMKKPGRLFIEGSNYFLQSVPEQEIPRVSKRLMAALKRLWVRRVLRDAKPFRSALQQARAMGIQVIPLGRNNLSDVAASTPWLTAIHNYAAYNLTEKQWAQKARRHHPTPQDVVLIHSDHVKGFVEQYAGRARVLWVNPPKRKTRIDDRLPIKEVELLRLARNAERKKRQEAIRRRKALNKPKPIK